MGVPRAVTLQLGWWESQDALPRMGGCCAAREGTSTPGLGPCGVLWARQCHSDIKAGTCERG